MRGARPVSAKNHSANPRPFNSLTGSNLFFLVITRVLASNGAPSAMAQSLTNRDAYIAFNMMEQVGPVRVRNLVEAFGEARAVLEASETELARTPGVGRECAKSIAAGRTTIDPIAEEKRANKLGIRLVTFIDDDYPELLKQIHDPPLVLYVKGTLSPSDRHGLAVVGTRHMTHYGSNIADVLSYGLAKAGFTVISGLARGIDTVAHKAALKAGGRTLAVLGSAIDKLYPAENADLAEQIAGQGAVISEYPLGRPPDRQTFPYRNRIVAGMCVGLLIVEAGDKSGAVITANAALEQGRHVYAVPGRIDSPASKGCHVLIKQGAKLVETIDDIVEDLQLLIPKRIDRQAEALRRGPDVSLSPEEVAVVKALAQGELHVDVLARESGLGAGRLNSLLLGLEMKRTVRILPGRFVALREGLVPSRVA